jgi:hypothetical protein
MWIYTAINYRFKGPWKLRDHGTKSTTKGASEAKCKVVPVLLTEHDAMKAYWGGGIVPVTLTSELDGGERSPSRPGHFTPMERALGTHCV